MKYKLVATDFDDTLLRTDLTISDYTKKTIDSFIKAGGCFTIATGRMYSSILPGIKRLGLKGLVISYNGGMIVDADTGEVVFQQDIPHDKAMEQLLLLESQPADIHVYYGDKLYVKERTEATKRYEHVCEVTANVTGESMSAFVGRQGVDITKILAVMPADLAKENFDRSIRAYGSRLDFSLSKPVFFEIMDKGVNKGEALKRLCGIKGIDISETMAFGDSLNDLQMLVAAGRSFAVENANPLAKQAADEICPSNDEDGVAKMIEKYCL